MERGTVLMIEPPELLEDFGVVRIILYDLFVSIFSANVLCGGEDQQT